MPARVTLEVVQGPLAAQEFVFDERTTCIIGRDRECRPRIPNDPELRTISRHHCLLDVNPPEVRVRDFGSLNGTYVNGHNIGRRWKGRTRNEADRAGFREYDLKHGDEIRLGKRGTLFRVGIFIPTYCVDCSAEIPESEKIQAETEPGVYRCGRCRADARVIARPRPKGGPKLCAKCGRDVSGEVGAGRQGEYICPACRDDPRDLMKLLLDVANTGRRELRAIAGYEIVKELGRGGMGVVYLGRHRPTGRLEALKVMLPRVAADPHGADAFLREIANMKALRHPNVVELHDSGHSHGSFFFTLEFCNSGSVHERMAQCGGTLSIAEAGPITVQALKGLEYAHGVEVPEVKLEDGTVSKARGLVHRDLKPQNVLLSEASGSRVAKLGDYGLAKAFDLAGWSGHTCTGEVAGTAYYMPRQQVLNYRKAGPEVDVWAMAATFYAMLTGHVPRHFSNSRDKWQTVLQTDAVPIRRRNSRIPKRLAQVIDHALRDRPEIGFQTAAEFRRALEGVL